MGATISHVGIVDSIGEGCVSVRILQTSACAACKVAGHCNASDSKEKLIDVMAGNAIPGLKVGDSVTVCASRDMAGRALLLGFGIPLLVMVVVLFLVLRLTSNEGIAALSALLALAPYYIVLYLFRKRIGGQLSFRIEQNIIN